MSTTQSGKTLLTETRDLMRRLHYSIHKVEENCRVEIYRPITVDPTTVERRDLKED